MYLIEKYIEWNERWEVLAKLPKQEHAIEKAKTHKSMYGGKLRVREEDCDESLAYNIEL